MMQTQTILDRINTLPRIKLARLNTPFEEMPRLRAAIADSMDADPNANKCAVPQPLHQPRRHYGASHSAATKLGHMEFLFAHLVDRGIDTIVNINHYDSNNARLVSAACAKNRHQVPLGRLRHALTNPSPATSSSDTSPAPSSTAYPQNTPDP